MKTALLVLDIINELVHENGHAGMDGFYAHSRQRGILANTAIAIDHARRGGIPVIYVVVGFSPGYPEWSDHPKLFRPIKGKGQILLGSWSTDIHDAIRPKPGELIVAKNRIDPFYGTNLEIILRSMGIEQLFLAGVSTEFVILATAMSGHDRGYLVKVIEECVSSSDDRSHECAMAIIAKIADISNLDEFAATTLEFA